MEGGMVEGRDGGRDGGGGELMRWPLMQQEGGWETGKKGFQSVEEFPWKLQPFMRTS